MSVGVLEVGFGNLPSLRRILNQIDVEAFEILDVDSLIEANHLIIPGVGSFASAMAFINEKGFAEALRQRCLSQHRPTLGICLGAQILLEEGSEGGDHHGVGIFKGRVVNLSSTLDSQSSHNGWDKVRVSKDFLGFQKDMNFDAYFNHDFIFNVTDSSDIYALSDHGGIFPVVLKKNSTYAVQFHPEKSQSAGLHLIKEFVGIPDV